MADGTEPTTSPEVPEDLTVFTEDALTALHADLSAAYNALRPGARSIPDVANLQTMRANMERIAGEITARAENTQSLQSLPESAPALSTPTEPPAEPEPAEPAEPEPVPEATAPIVELAPPADMPISVAAALSMSDIIDNREPGTPPPTSSRARTAALLTVAPGSTFASAGTVVAQGSEMDFDLFGRMLDDAKAMNRPGKAILASVGSYALETREQATEALHNGRPGSVLGDGRGDL